MLFALLAGGVSPAWADELTVYDGTTTNSYVPVYGLYIDTEGTKAEYIIPATELADLVGGTISGLTYYLSSTPSWGALEYKVFLKEVTEENYSSATLLGDTDATVVYEGTITPASNKLDINFTTNYTYNGGNLLVGFYLTKTGSYASGNFYGKSVTNAAVNSYSGWNGTSTSQQSFIPKTTFTYTPAAGTVKKPTGLTASNVTYQGAMLSWTPGEDETEWEVAYNKTGETPNAEGSYTSVSTNPSIAIAGLDVETTYYAFVRAKKDDKYSKWSNSVSFTTTERYPTPTGLAISNLTTISATLTWTAGAATSWEVAINTTGETPSNDAGTGVEVNTAAYDFSELTAETTYYAFVREKDGDNYSAWSAACEFTPSANTYLTVNDGTTTNAYVPVYGYFTAAANLGGQFIIPSANLTDVQNKVIKKLTFYSSASEYAYGDAEFDVLIKEVDDATMTSSMYAWDDSWTTVYSGKLAIVGGKMNITFSSDYNYNGSNLLVGIHKTSTDKAGSNYNITFYGTNAGSGNYRSNYAPYGNRQTFQPKTTIGYQEKVGAELKVFDGTTELTENPASFDFGLAAAGDTHTFTLKNTAATSYVATISSTNLTVSPTEVTPDVDGETFTVEMPNHDITNEPVVITPAAASGLEAFTINVSGTVRDASKLYESGFTALPTGWSVDGTWNYNSANGAYTTAWYIDQQTLARLKTPMLTIAAGEKFIVEAKGYSTDNTGYQHMVLQYSTNGTDWTTFSEDLALDPTNWKTFTVTWPTDVDAGNYYIGLLASQADIRMFYGGEVASGANFAINTNGSTQDFGKVAVNADAEKIYTITNSGDADLEVTFTAPEGFSVINESTSFLLTDNFGWGQAYVYAWDADGQALNGGWPGATQAETSINDYGETQFIINVPQGAVGVIVNNGNGAQTENITNFSYTGYWMDGSKDNLGHYVVTGWNNGSGSQTENTNSVTIPAKGIRYFTVKMDTQTPGVKSGNVVLAFDALNATSFTIPCTGTVLDPNYLIVDFENKAFPEGWQVGADWSADTGTAIQSNTKTASALVTTPLTVAENETLTFKAARNASGYGNVTSLKTRYSTNGGATWSEYTTYTIESSALTEQTLSGVPKGTVILEFFGSNIKLDDIEGFTKTNAPALALTEGDVAVVNGSTKDFGILSATASATYVLKNTGNADLVSTLGVTEGFNFSVTATDEGVTKTDNTLTIPAGKTATIKVELTPGSTYGEVTGLLTIDSEGWVGDFVVNYTATLIDETDFVEDFSNGMPAGWYNGGNGGWTVSGGEAHVYTGTDRMLITEKLGIAAGKDVLSFDAKVYSGNDNQTLKVYTSEDRINWSEAKTFTLTTEVQNFTLDALTTDSYVMFEASNASVDNLTGVKKLDLPDHDLMFVGVSGLKTDYTPNEAVSATVQIANLLANAEENVYVWVYYRKSNQSFSSPWVTDGPEEIAATATKAISLSANAPEEEALYDVMIVVNTSDDNTQPLIRLYQYEAFTVTHVTSLAVTGFEPVETIVQADDDNNFTAEFNVTVTNNGTLGLDLDKVSVSVTNTSDEVLGTSALNAQTVYLNAGNYSTDVNLAIYRWSTDTDQEWALFTEVANGWYSASLNGKEKFIICRVNPAIPESELGWGNTIVYNQSDDFKAEDGTIMGNNGYKGENNKTLNLTQSSKLLAGESVTLNVSVTASAGNGGTFEFKAKENVTSTFWVSGENYIKSVTVNKKPTTVTATIGAAGYTTFASAYSLDLDELGYGLEAYYVKADGVNSDAVKLTKATGKVKPGTGLVLKGNQGSYSIGTAQSSESDAIDGNLMVGCTTDTAVPQNAGYYVLANHEGEAQFQSLADHGLTIPAGKAYLDATSIVNGNARLTIVIDDDTTGIMSILREKGLDGDIYTIEGIRVENPKKGGLYIINGKKVVIK